MRPHVTAHAIDRYRERIADLPDSEIIANLDTPAIRAAAEFGCECRVRLPTGHRIVVKDHTIVTVTPAPLVRRCRVRRGGF